MKRRHLLAGLATLPAFPARAFNPWIETPSLEPLVAAGTLPPIEARIPLSPRIIDMPVLGRTEGVHGGTWRMLIAGQRDIRLMTMFGYARLVHFNEQSELIADILDRYTVEEGRIFTLHLRAGHRWSDGAPFTSDDFRFWWEDVGNNKRLSPSGLPAQMMVDGKPPKFEVLGPAAVRFTWAAPNPVFLPALAAAQPMSIFMPAHYLKQFHSRHAVADALNALVKAARVRDWGALHERKSRQYRPENPDLPMLDPWLNRTAPPAEQFLFERNPYFHRVDNAGRQLPYIDRVTLSVSSGSLIAAKVGSGETDLQPRYIRFENYTFLRESEKRHNYSVRLWTRGEGSYAALLPNLNAADLVWRSVLRDVRVRRALSVGIDRRDINRVIFFGLAHESANAVLPGSSLHNAAFDAAWAQYDIALANRLLDEAGLGKRGLDGTRLLPDGRKMEITIETAAENGEEIDIIELVTADWAKLGIRAFARSTQRDVFRRRITAGQTIMAFSTGYENGYPGPDMDPEQLAPTNSSQLQWPQWGKHAESMGAEGQPPDLPAAEELMQLYASWRTSTTHDQRRDIWMKMLDINAQQVFTIGIVNATAQPIVVSNRLRNVPETAVYNFEPGAFLGVTMPDAYWFDPSVA
jgi:peptide/nickel transport system substrate-binding protein